MCLPQTEFKVTVWSVWMFKIPVGPQSLVFSTAPEFWVPQACTPDWKKKSWIMYLDTLAAHFKSHSKLKSKIMLRAAHENFLLNQNSSLFTLTFGEKFWL